MIELLELLGTWIAGISTLIGVVIAYRQLIQPTVVKIRIGDLVIQELNSNQSPILHIRFFNNRIKTAFMENIGYCIDDNFIEFSDGFAKFEIIGKNDTLWFPYSLDQNTFIDVSIDYNLFKKIVNSTLGVLNKNENSKISFAYKDCCNRIHRSKPISIEKFYKIYDKIF